MVNLCAPRISVTPVDAKNAIATHVDVKLPIPSDKKRSNCDLIVYQKSNLSDKWSRKSSRTDILLPAHVQFLSVRTKCGAAKQTALQHVKSLLLGG